MPNLIQIKRSATTATPPTLAVGELAWSEVSKTLFIGESGQEFFQQRVIAVFRGQNPPGISLLVIFLHAIPGHVENPKVML